MPAWTVITMPSTPSAPQSVEVTMKSPVALSQSPFTGQQQVQIWGASWRELSVQLPPLTESQAQDWIDFLVNLQGMANVFQFGAAFTTAFPKTVPAGKYYRLKSNDAKWSLNLAQIYGIQFECVEAF